MRQHIPAGFETSPGRIAASRTLAAKAIHIMPERSATGRALWAKRPVEVAVVADPAANDGIVDLGQILQGFVAAEMKRLVPDFPADPR
jgi:hypothetical protein